MSEKTRLIKNTGLIAIGNMGAKVVSFLLLPLYTSILTTEEYGTYDFIVAVCAFLLPVITVSMHEAMFRFIIENKIPFKDVVSHSFFVVFSGIILSTAIIGILVCIHPFDYWKPLLCFLIVNALYAFGINLVRGLGRTKEFAVITSCKNILRVILNVLAIAVLKLGFNGLILSTCIAEILALIVVIFRVRLWKYIRFNNLSLSIFKEMLHYSLPLIPDSICAQIINVSDRLIIKGFLGAGPNGIYSISYKFPNIVETVYHFFYTAWSESASRIIKKGKDAAEKYYQDLYKMLDNVTSSTIFLMIAGMPILFRIFIRGDYVQGFKYIPILMLSMYFDSIGKVYSGIFTAIKKTKIMAVSTFVAALINVVINLIFIKSWGLYAAAISTLVAEIVMILIRAIALKKHITLKHNFKHYALEIVIAIVLVCLYSYDNWINTAISIVIATVYTIIFNKNTIAKVIKKLLNRFNISKEKQN